MTDRDFLDAFENCAIPAGEFHHPDHVRLVWLYLQQYPVTDVLDRFSAALKRFARANGKEGLYHATITWAFIFLINERIVRSGQSSNWTQFAEGNPDLLKWKDSVLDRYYRKETLTSDLARSIFLFPDKIAFK